MKSPPSSSRMNSSKWLVVVLVVVFFVGSYFVRLYLGDGTASSVENVEPLTSPQRIVGLAPSTVEVLYEVGLGDQVVGVSRYCTYPPEALGKPKIAGFLDVDFEALVSLKPDCVVMVDSQHSLVDKMNQLGIRSISAEHASVDGIISSFKKIGKACGKEKESIFKAEQMQAHIDATRKKLVGQPRPRVLVCIERDPDSPRPDRVIAAGSGGFHRELINIAGGVNAYQGSIAYPVLSREKLLNLNPDVIIDLVRDEVFEKYKEQPLLRQWYAFGELNAVKNNRVVIIAGNQHLIPGPRFLDTLDKMVEAIHPGNEKLIIDN
jgi:iron complex transport system substrate-binding protein